VIVHVSPHAACADSSKKVAISSMYSTVKLLVLLVLLVLASLNDTFMLRPKKSLFGASFGCEEQLATSKRNKP